MQIIPLDNESQLRTIKESPEPSIIFIHNTSCPISRGVWSGLQTEQSMLPDNQRFYLLDMRQHVDISNAVSVEFNIEHQSPQLLLIRNGQCVYEESLSYISAEMVAQALKE